jgi:hypothetical protein
VSCQPKGLARAALEREDRKTPAALQGAHAAVSLQLGTVPLQDGRVNLVDRRGCRILGIAVNEKVAEQTRKFFQ